MIEFISQNLGTIVVGLLVLAGVVAIVVNMARNKKRGKCAGCAGCSSSSECAGAPHNSNLPR